MRLLYLDFDGVLHPDDVWHVLGIGPELRNVNGHHLFEHSDLLVALIGASDDVGVVLSTSWVFTYDLADVLFRLPDALRQRVVGSTFDAARHGPGFAPVARSHQVLDDVQRRRPLDWAALHDDGRDWPDEHRGNLIQTDPAQGLGADAAQAALHDWLLGPS